MKKRVLLAGFIFIDMAVLASCEGTPVCEVIEPQAVLSQIPTAPEQVDGMEMVYVPAGNFLMGASEDEKDALETERKQRCVYLDAFWIDKTEITNAQYAQCEEAGACAPPADRRNYKKDSFANHPVAFVSWYDASNYCDWAGRRLPSEAEWEKAARGVDGRKYPWGEVLSCENVNYFEDCSEFASTSPVGFFGEKGVSPYGAMDMSGNLWEWVEDWYKEDFYHIAPDENPSNMDSASGLKVLRGGSWNSEARFIRTTHRDGSKPESTSAYIGFRCALTAD